MNNINKNSKHFLSGLWLKAIAIIVLGISPGTFGATNEKSCHSIEDDAERLLCYDSTIPEANDKSSIQSDSRPTLLEDRFQKEQRVTYHQFAITPYKPNYMLPITYNANPNKELYETLTPDDDIAKDFDNYELKFQLSFKIPLIKEFIFKESSLWFGYTQVAFWQMYNLDSSAPFRETDYEPELIWASNTNFSVAGFKNTLITLAFNHQSNGRSKPLSRSWNRIVANFLLEKDNVVLSFRPWYRIPEDKDDDDNPDIEKYLGYADIAVLFKYRDHLSTIGFRNNFRSDDNRTTFQLTYTFPINKRLKGMAQYFNGYGESLIDYNHRSNRLGIGILLTDWI